MGTRVDARDFYLYRVFRELFCIAGDRDGTIELPLQVVVMLKSTKRVQKLLSNVSMSLGKCCTNPPYRLMRSQ